jgi:hypothetical protein
LAGATAIADNFNTADAIEPTSYGPNGSGGTPPVSSDTVGAFRMFCHPGQLLKDDPLVYPGQPGVSHLHQFYGNAGTNANSDYAALRGSGNTTCGLATAPVNRSAYWMPAMLDGVGDAVKPDYMNVYYKRQPKGSAGDGDPSISGNVGYQTDLPNGIRYVFGYNMKTMTGGPNDTNSQDYWAMHFECWGSLDGTVGNNGATGFYHTFDQVRAAGCPVGARLMIIAAAPNCWDGVNLDSADHRSHVHMSDGPQYPGQFFRACPSTHPYVVDNLEVQVAYTIDANFVAGKWLLSSDEMVPGIAAGSTWHMDYWEAWSPTVKATWHQYCINGHLTCSGGDLGNGTDMKASNLYPISDYPKHQLVALSSIPSTPTTTPTTQTCPDGSVIPITQTCPAPTQTPTTKTCPDGSVIPSTQTCPVTTTTRPGKAIGRKK